MAVLVYMTQFTNMLVFCMSIILPRKQPLSIFMSMNFIQQRQAWEGRRGGGMVGRALGMVGAWEGCWRTVCQIRHRCQSLYTQTSHWTRNHWVSTHFTSITYYCWFESSLWWRTYTWLEWVAVLSLTHRLSDLCAQLSTSPEYDEVSAVSRTDCEYPGNWSLPWQRVWRYGVCRGLCCWSLWVIYGLDNNIVCFRDFMPFVDKYYMFIGIHIWIYM